LIGWATEIKVRAERRTGELLKVTAERGERAGRGHPLKTSSNGDVSPAPTLRDLGISENQSSQWQKLAALPEKEFEQRLGGGTPPLDHTVYVRIP
jgi:hypothetical protein